MNMTSSVKVDLIKQNVEWLNNYFIGEEQYISIV